MNTQFLIQILKRNRPISYSTKLADAEQQSYLNRLAVAWEDTVLDFANFLLTSDTGFDKSKFLTECGYQQY
jgi:hypothetical protein